MEKLFLGGCQNGLFKFLFQNQRTVSPCKNLPPLLIVLPAPTHTTHAIVISLSRYTSWIQCNISTPSLNGR